MFTDKRKKILKLLLILQERREMSEGGYSEAIRFNPYNPLSYVLLAIMALVCFVLFGITGFRQEWENPFKWGG